MTYEIYFIISTDIISSIMTIVQAGSGGLQQPTCTNWQFDQSHKIMHFKLRASHKRLQKPKNDSINYKLCFLWLALNNGFFQEPYMCPSFLTTNSL